MEEPLETLLCTITIHLTGVLGFRGATPEVQTPVVMPLTWMEAETVLCPRSTFTVKGTPGVGAL